MGILGTDAQGRAHYDLRADVVRPCAGRAGGGVLHGGSVAAGVSGDQRDGAATGTLRDGPAKVLAAHRSRRAAAAASGADGKKTQKGGEAPRGRGRAGRSGT